MSLWNLYSRAILSLSNSRFIGVLALLSGHVAKWSQRSLHPKDHRVPVLPWRNGYCAVWCVCPGGLYFPSYPHSFLCFAYKHTPLVRANSMELSFLLLLFLVVCFVIGLLFIGEPSNWLCRVRYPAFGISFALCTSCLLAKIVVVLMAFRSLLGRNIMIWFGPRLQRASVLMGTAVQVETFLVGQLCVEFSLQSSMSFPHLIICHIWLLTSLPHLNSNYHSATVIIECAAGSEVGFWCSLGYISILACTCFLAAFLAWKLLDNFNEAKFITFSVLIFFAAWITFIPVYISTAGKYTVAPHIFASLASTFGLLSCIFAPKCYIIILRPEKNNKKNITQRWKWCLISAMIGAFNSTEPN